MQTFQYLFQNSDLWQQYGRNRFQKFSRESLSKNLHMYEVQYVRNSRSLLILYPLLNSKLQNQYANIKALFVLKFLPCFLDASQGNLQKSDILLICVNDLSSILLMLSVWSAELAQAPQSASKGQPSISDIYGYYQVVFEL